MAEAFDPYTQWLGIRDPQRPPNHYRLLGVELFEPDANVISHAADRQMAHVRTFQSGKHSAESQRLLNELAAAKICLLNEQKKAAYDAGLRAQQEATPPPLPPSEVAAPPLPDTVTSPEPPPAPAAPQLPTPPEANEQRESPAFATRKSKRFRKESRRSTLATMLSPLILVAAGLVVFAIVRSQDGEKPHDGTEVATGNQPGDVGEDELDEPATVPDASVTAPTPDEPVDPTVVDPAPDEPPPEDQPDETPPSVEPEPEPTPPEVTPVVRAVPPSDNRRRELIREIRELLAQEYFAASSTAGKRALARLLMEKAEGTTDDPEARYVLLLQAIDQAIAAGQSQLLLRAIDLLGREYRVDIRRMAAETLRDEAKKARETAANRAIARAALQLADEALAADAFAEALMTTEAARDMARACRPRDMDLLADAVALMRKVESVTQLHEAVVEAEKVLATAPDDPRANLTAGVFYFLVKDDADRGLPMLARSGDAALAALAQAEAAATDPAAAARLADGWYDVAAAADDRLRPWFARRAADWHRQVLPHASGLTKVKLEHRLEELDRWVGQ